MCLDFIPVWKNYDLGFCLCLEKRVLRFFRAQIFGFEKKLWLEILFAVEKICLRFCSRSRKNCPLTFCLSLKKCTWIFYSRFRKITTWVFVSVWKKTFCGFLGHKFRIWEKLRLVISFPFEKLRLEILFSFEKTWLRFYSSFGKNATWGFVYLWKKCNLRFYSSFGKNHDLGFCFRLGKTRLSVF